MQPLCEEQGIIEQVIVKVIVNELTQLGRDTRIDCFLP